MATKPLRASMERAQMRSRGLNPDVARPETRELRDNESSKTPHDHHDFMTKLKFRSDHDLNDSRSLVYPLASRDHESRAEKNSTPWRAGDTQVPARYLMVLVNTDETFQRAQAQLGLYPQKLFTLTQHTVRQTGDYQRGVLRAQQAIDFVLSLLTEVPYFQCTKDGHYDPNPAAMTTRARNMLIDLLMSGKPLLEKYAGPRYRRKWGGM